MLFTCVIKHEDAALEEIDRMLNDQDDGFHFVGYDEAEVTVLHTGERLKDAILLRCKGSWWAYRKLKHQLRDSTPMYRGVGNYCSDYDLQFDVYNAVDKED